jgi:hypothetical protein
MKKVKPLTLPQLEQLESYCKMMEIEGYYFGSKPQWDNRHEQIKQWIQKCKEQLNEH